MAEEEKKELAEEQENEPAAEPEKTPAAKAPEKEKKPKKAGKNPFKSKKFKHGSLSVVFTAIFVAAVVLINVIFNLLLDRFDIKADMTEGGIYTAGEEIMFFAEHDTSTVHFYFTSEKDTLENAGDVIYKQTVKLVEQLVSKNKGYNAEYKDLLTDPAFAEAHGVSREGGLIVSCGETGREKSFNISDFKKYVMNDGNSYPASEAQMMSYYGYQIVEETSIAEQEILSAMLSVTKINPINVAFLTGFGEQTNTALSDLLEKNAYVVEELDIDREPSVPDKYDIVVINAPEMDYSNDALTKIDEWLSNGGLYGKNLVYLAKTYPPATTPNINAYLEEWGITVGEGYLLQMDANYAYTDLNTGLPFFQRAEIADDSEYYGAMKIRDNTIFPTYYVRPVLRLWNEKSNYKVSTIVRTTGDKCTFMPFDQDAEMQSGQYDLITASAKSRYEGTELICSRVIASGGETLFSSDFLGATNYNSAEVAVGIFNTVSGNTDEQVTITPKSFTAATFEIDSAQQTGIGLAFAVIIPAAIIITGIIVWIRRRRL